VAGDQFIAAMGGDELGASQPSSVVEVDLGVRRLAIGNDAPGAMNGFYWRFGALGTSCGREPLLGAHDPFCDGDAATGRSSTGVPGSGATPKLQVPVEAFVENTI
jgi:hypothetical protein